MSHLLARLRSAFTPAVPPTPDVELLSRFLSANDQDAFAELVRRYGPMVLGVCRRTLGDGPDAEDAYQGVFLVLAKRAATVRGIGRVAGWLHGVATLTAKKARTRRAKVRRQEQTGSLPDVPARPEPNAELAAVLDEELASIPERYRTAVVLCELRQLALDQAAVELGVPRGTVASRLARGREQLGKRLLRRGLFSVLPPVVSAGPLPVEPTPAADSLSREVLRTMTASQLRWLPLLAVPLFAVTFGLFAADPPKPTAPPPKAEEKEKPKRNATVERVKLVGVGGLLEQQAIRKELNLTKEQEEKLKEAKAEAGKQLKEISAATDKLRGKDDISKYLNSNEQYTDVLAAHDLTASKLLNPEQLYRLKQIYLQREGPTALLSRYAVRELGYTPEQEDKLAEAMKPLLKPKLMDIVPQALAVSDSSERGKIVQQLSAALDAVREDAMKCLTVDQQTKWKEMIGEEVATAILVVASPESFVWATVINGGK